MSRIASDKVIESIARHMQVDIVPVVVDFEKSQGNRLVDGATGIEYLDCFSYIASNPIGHNHPKMSEPEFEKKLLRAAKVKPSNPDFFSSELAEFVDTFAQSVMPAEFSRVFFVEGGAQAVENAMKVAFDWKVRKNLAAGREELGSKILHFRQAFHGRSGYTLSVTNTADPRKTKYFPKFDWPRVTNPKITFPLSDQNLAAVQGLEAQTETEIRAAFDQHPHDIAGILIEPIQGEGGDNHFRPEFHQLLRKIADQYEAMLLYDEVQTGLGLTGKIWAYQHYGIVPDVVAFGKKMQLGGILAGPKLSEVNSHVFAEASRINSTWGGGLCDMVRCERYLQIIAEDNLISNAETVGEILLSELVQLTEEYSDDLSSARGKGLMCAFDAKTPELRDKIFVECFKRCVLLLKCGTHSIRLRPSLTFSQADVSELMPILRQAVTASI